MIAKMCVDYPQLSPSDYLIYEPRKEAGGWKYLHYAVERGAFATYEEAGESIFSKYFRADPQTDSVQEFCQIVKQAGGVPVIAHPGNKDREEIFGFLRELQDRGIEGVECFYPAHSKQSTECYLDYCRRNDLRITGGSDCHSRYDRTAGFSLGDLKIPLEALDLREIKIS